MCWFGTVQKEVVVYESIYNSSVAVCCSCFWTDRFDLCIELSDYVVFRIIIIVNYKLDLSVWIEVNTCYSDTHCFNFYRVAYFSALSLVVVCMLLLVLNFLLGL